jgi:hypothetical protein
MHRLYEVESDVVMHDEFWTIWKEAVTTCSKHLSGRTEESLENRLQREKKKGLPE